MNDIIQYMSSIILDKCMGAGNSSEFPYNGQLFGNLP